MMKAVLSSVPIYALSLYRCSDSMAARCDKIQHHLFLGERKRDLNGA
jgi:hypothetical protein